MGYNYFYSLDESNRLLSYLINQKYLSLTEKRCYILDYDFYYSIFVLNEDLNKIAYFTKDENLFSLIYLDLVKGNCKKSGLKSDKKIEEFCIS